MRSRVSVWSTAAAIGGAALMLAATPVMASTPTNDKTVFTFDGPVMVPGATLHAGTYIFRLADTRADRSLVEITSQNGSTLYVRTFTVPIRRLDASDDVVVTFSETKPGIAPAIRDWFYPGRLTGHQFVYPDNQAAVIEHVTKTLALSPDGDHGSVRKATHEVATSGMHPQSEWKHAPRVVSGDDDGHASSD